MKLLYVDDKKTWHKLFEIVLSLRGIEVLHAYTPKEALNIASSEKPDVAVVDVSLVNGTAYDLVPDLLRLGIPVIVVGYRAEGFDRDKALSLGAYDAVEKPFTVEEFLELLRRVKREAPRPEEKLELVVPESGELEVVNLEPEIEEVSTSEAGEVPVLEPEVPVVPVEEHEESVPVVPVETEETEEVPVAQPEEFGEKVLEEAKEEVKSRAEEISGVELPQDRLEAIIREVAWEVVPEIAERIIREEIEKLIRSRLA